MFVFVAMRPLLVLLWPWCSFSLVLRGDPTESKLGDDPLDWDVWDTTVDVDTRPVGDDTCWDRHELSGAVCWRRPEQCANCEPPPRVAIAFRGHYHRKIRTKHPIDPKFGFHPLICSDAFHNLDSHTKQIVEPLQATGASVKTYFHTYQSGDDEASRQRDERLVQLLSPARYEFAAHSEGERVPLEIPGDGDDYDEDDTRAEEDSQMIVDSFIKVLELVLQDKESIDAVVLTRFDLQFRAEITALNVRWNVTNGAHREGSHSWDSEKKISDIFFVIPIGHVETFIESLKISATNPLHHRPTGAGHWVYTPFVEKMGGDPSVLHLIDSHISPSSQFPAETVSFLALSRACTKE
jgi:hypothetical protein